MQVATAAGEQTRRTCAGVCSLRLQTPADSLLSIAKRTVIENWHQYGVHADLVTGAVLNPMLFC
jgi:hypothetical protein